MPVAFGLSVLAVAVALAYRDRIYGHLPGPAWRAALAGGLAAGIAGALTNDSGPLLFVVAVFVLGVVTAYLHGTSRSPAAAATLGGSTASASPSGPGGPVPAGVSAGDRQSP
jgi:hypothetical protein